MYLITVLEESWKRKGLLNQKTRVYVPLCHFFQLASNPSSILWETQWQFLLKAGKGNSWLVLRDSRVYFTAAQNASAFLLLLV
jgi:hypothetical protein